MKNKLPCMIRPCSNCPFRKDIPQTKGWLGEKRAAEIVNVDLFVCHKTAYGEEKDQRQCAGHMILLKEENLFYRTAKGMKLLPNLKGQNTVVDTKQDFINRHKYRK